MYPQLHYIDSKSRPRLYAPSSALSTTPTFSTHISFKTKKFFYLTLKLNSPRLPLKTFHSSCYNRHAQNSNNNNDNDPNPGYTGKASNIINLNGVINISSLDLTDAQISLLSKGLNFCPTPGNLNTWDVKADLERLHRSLRLRHIFKNPQTDSQPATSQPTISQTSTQDLLGCADTPDDIAHTTSLGPDGVPQRLFKSTCTWNPKYAHKNIETFATVNFSDLSKLRDCKPKFHNLTKAEKEALTQLKLNTEIIIKPADKGAGVVVMNTADYIFEAKRQLSSKSYAPSNKEFLTEATRQVSSAIQNMHTSGSIDKKRQQYLTPTNPKPGKFYLLPKIHKMVLPPPGRPIVSQTGSPTEKISGYLDYFLQPFLPSIPSYIKDTGHFLKIINDLGEIPSDSFLVTLDVTSLYTNIPINEAKIAAAKALYTLRGPSNTPTNQQLLLLLDLILKLNIFTFSTGTEILYYLQTIGIAMGTKAAVAIANIFMHFFEDKYIFQNQNLLKPLLYKRFIDDIFMIWTHTRLELDNFIQYLNQVHPTIKFTANVSNTNIDFLDTTVHLSERKLRTELYTKPTNAQAYLLRTSYHPKHIFNSLPYGEFLRIRRNCSDLESFDKHAKNMFLAFQKRGYEHKILKEAHDKARLKNRDLMLSKYESTNTLNEAFLQTQTQPTIDTPIFFITKYHESIKPIKNFLTENWELLGKSRDTEHLYTSKLTTGFRKNTNLKNLLCQSQIPLRAPTPGLGGLIVRDCPNSENCTICPYLDTSGKITSSKNKKSFFSRAKALCTSHNIIYGLTCNTCGKQYVGQTKRRFDQRFKEHTKDLTKDNLDEAKQPVAKHLTQPDHTGNIDQITCHILDFIKFPAHSDRAALERNEKERIWIARLETVRPHGLNTMEPKPFLRSVNFK